MGGQEAVSDEIAVIAAAYASAASALERIADPREAFRAATEIADALQKLAEEAALLRATTAMRIREADELSLAELAGKISLSRSRAFQLVKQAKAQRRDQESSDDG